MEISGNEIKELINGNKKYKIGLVTHLANGCILLSLEDKDRNIMEIEVSLKKYSDIVASNVKKTKVSEPTINKIKRKRRTKEQMLSDTLAKRQERKDAEIKERGG